MADILAAHRPLLADGAMATTLFERGLRLGDPAEAWTLAHPDRVAQVHGDFVAAGADLLLTNSFGGHPWRLRAHGLEERVAMLNAAAARLARDAADAAGRTVIVAGSVGPTSATQVTDEAAAGFDVQTRALAGGGVDLLWIETMSYPAEMRMAAAAAAATGLPYGLTAHFGADGRTLGGLAAADFARLATGLPVPPCLIGANCGSDIESLLAAIAAMRGVAPWLPLAIKASAGLPEMRQGRLHYPMRPEAMADYAVRAVATGAFIVGGCCGTMPAHVAAMRASMPPAHDAT